MEGSHSRETAPLLEDHRRNRKMGPPLPRPSFEDDANLPPGTFQLIRGML